ncbi:EAL domain-containing protein [Pseudarthrobacter phenanthrenivorans]|uniref:sensor domain-containing protein n=1 Tax=Pseudarthrobacter phenanthrenivorans TaxID=361575 RepID=UPI00344ED290
MTGGTGAGRLDFEALFHQAPCGYLIADDAGGIGAVNDTFLNWTGFSRRRLLMSRIQDLMPVGDQILYSTHAIPQLNITGGISELAIEIIGADGRRRAALLSAVRFPATDSRGPTVRIIIFGAHERRQYERELVSALRAAEEAESRRSGAERELRRLALHDSLTGLLNRAGLVAKLDGYLAARAVSTSSVAALFIDLDHFKAVNDSLGHAAGDELLVAVAQRILETAPAAATVARLSGDEFIMVNAFQDHQQATDHAARLLDVLRTPMLLQDLEIVSTASIGVALAEDAGETVEGLVRRADIALYRAKTLGRNRWELHRPTEADPTVDRLRALGELRNGISNGALRVHYQPRVDLLSGHARGMESLVRWQHPTRGLLPPADFIGMAEDSGLVRPLGAWVLDETLRQAEKWRQEDPDTVRLQYAVNLSARQLNDPDLVGLVEEALQGRGMDPSRLLLEITETALMTDPEAALSSLTSLKDIGVGLAVDDFGTGYSSLTYLKKFPVDELKIDRSFIAGLGEKAGDEAIVESCIDLAHAVGIRAVAEGVETPAQVEALRAMGCDLAQGYHYARPLPAPLIKEWLDANSH